MAYEAKTQNDLAKWWVIGTGSVVNRLSEIMDDCPLGPAIYYTTGWANTPPSLEYSRAVTTAPDSVDEKIGAGAWAALVAGVVGSLNAGEWGYAAGTLWVRLTGDAVPNATNQVRAHYLWDGSGAGPAFMTEVVEDAIYRLHIRFENGDATTATTLNSNNEHVYFDSGVVLYLRTNSTLNIGTIASSRGHSGSFWSFGPSDHMTLLQPGAILNVGASMLHLRTNFNIRLSAGTVNVVDSILSGVGVGESNNFRVSDTVSFTIDFSYLNKTRSMYFLSTPTLMTNFRANANTLYGVEVTSGRSVTASDVLITNSTTADVKCSDANSNMTLVDSNFSSVDHNLASQVTYNKKTINLHIADKDGINISGATVDCEDQYGTACWVAGSVTTAADGTIAEQIVTYKKYEGSSETVTTYSPHKFTISAPGYETLVLDNITVDGPIDWHLELQDTQGGARVYQIGIGIV